ncbi:U-box domain-containing protein 27-like [Diospyros lotus]|uniref:U-box domain-containing protein 27-like n=1 Tax=Diospyros lotus TaxID=55363 RepID=UPI0022548A6C|nr:U-box domain-containing protein 27-like [Diospyros lotus]
MGRDDLYITVPSFFRCPISLDVMKSPVSLCTGVTYDRSSIQRWLDSGKNTCPATMQVLQTRDLVPNHTLQRLIQLWSDSVKARPSPITPSQARELVAQLRQSGDYSQPISKLVSFARGSDQNRRFLAAIDGFVPLLVDILGNSSNMIANAEEMLIILQLVLHDYKDRACITKSIMGKKNCFATSMIFVLKNGSLASRIATARLMELVASDAESKLFFAEYNDVLPELFRLLRSESDGDAIRAALSTLICVSMTKKIRVRMIQLGAVKVLGKLLSNANMSVAVNERLLELLEMFCSCKEGRAEMCKDESCIPAVVKKTLKVSTAATEHAVTILWSLCYLLRDEAAQAAVGRGNGVTKILLLMQSNCSPAVKQMAGDLLKVFRVNSKSRLPSYDTNTTHIMPF